MFEGFAALTAGKVWSDGGWRFANFDTTGFSTRVANGETGVLVRLVPWKGVSLGAFVPVPVAAQGMDVTFSRTNFGAGWAIGDAGALRASWRLEPDAGGSRELALGARLTAVPSLVLTVGWRNLAAAKENDIFLDASYGLAGVSLRAFADCNWIDAGFFYGGKAQVEYPLPRTPFVLGTVLSYGNGDAWYDKGFDVNPYARYVFGQSSVQVGFDAAWQDSAHFRIQLSHTVGF
jgi:hypothetical protein